MSEDMRKIIDKVKNFKQFTNERYEISNLPNNIVLLSKEKSDGGHFLLFNIETKTPIGYISFGYYPLIESDVVYGIYSKRGYGVFLYESAMTHVYPNGLGMSRDGSTSPDALDVWTKFDRRMDVRKKRFQSDEITHKMEDLPDGGTYDDNPKYLEYIFQLENTRFFYDYGKDKLNKLLNIGIKYKIKYNISDDDIEHMSWDLE
jgi:hypothetical protein